MTDKIDALRATKALEKMKENGFDMGLENEDYAALDAAIEALAEQPAGAKGAPHADDLAVDHFASAMKEKLAAARAKGRSGWNTEDATAKGLSILLRRHVEKGDPRDVANFCMFLYLRGESILPDTTPPAASVDVEGALDAADPAWRQMMRPNLTGSEALVCAVGDIAGERKMLAAEVRFLRDLIDSAGGAKGECNLVWTCRVCKENAERFNA